MNEKLLSNPVKVYVYTGVLIPNPTPYIWPWFSQLILESDRPIQSGFNEIIPEELKFLSNNHKNETFHPINLVSAWIPTSTTSIYRNFRDNTINKKKFLENIL